MKSERIALADRPWAVTAGLAGIAGIASYVLLITLDTSAAVSVLLAALFAFGFALTGVGLHLGVTGAVSPRLSLLGAIANAAAAVELLAMVLVQIAVKAVAPHPGQTMTAIWLGLDVAWDLFGGVGTVLFGIALWRHPRFSPAIGLGGILTATVLLILNVATFPLPPKDAGWFDAGPFVALWYVVLCVALLVVARSRGDRPDRPDQAARGEPWRESESGARAAAQAAR